MNSKTSFIAIAVACIAACASSATADPNGGTEKTGPYLDVSPGSEMQMETQAKGPKGIVKLQMHFEAIDLKELHVNRRTPRAYFGVSFDPQTGYFSYGVPNDAPPKEPNPVWAESTFVLPNYGMVYWAGGGGNIRMFVSRMKAENLTAAREKALTHARSQIANGKTPSSSEPLQVNVHLVLGADFFDYPRSAQPPPPSIPLSIEYSDAGWKIEIESRVTHEKAVLELDNTFKLQKAFRDGKQVYPKAEVK